MNFQKAEFVKSAANAGGLISDAFPKIVFAGKSNVGKSSVINAVLGRNNFARTGAQPGKTVHINYFRIDGKAYFTDLPGYGYAKVSDSERERWASLLETFFSDPENITLGIHIVDIRHKPTANDITMSECFRGVGCPLIVVANKCDKISATEARKNVEIIRETLQLPPEVEILPFSAKNGTGREALRGVITKIAEA